MFKKRDNIKEVEEGKYLEPKFDKNGLIPVITSDYKTGDILMHGYMNDEALKKTIETTKFPKSHRQDIQKVLKKKNK